MSLRNAPHFCELSSDGATCALCGRDLWHEVHIGMSAEEREPVAVNETTNGG